MNGKKFEPKSAEKDWRSKGYFHCPAPAPNTRPPVTPLADPWQWWQFACHRAKNGQFDLVPGLLEICQDPEDAIQAHMSATLLGDAGANKAFEPLIPLLRTTDNTELAVKLCLSLTLRGRLADVPVLLDALVDIGMDEGGDTIASGIARLLEADGMANSDPAAFTSFGDYCEAVMNRHQELIDQLGGDQVFVFRGEPVGVVSTARRLLEMVREPKLPLDLSRKFVVSTGIDCASWYEDGRLKSLIAADALEAFLESPDAAKYEDGVRYFFGHRVPD